MYPHERSLVKELKDKPFALLGINSDPKPHLKSVLKKENITWRSFWDGGDTEGPIATKWNVSSWPTIYIVDHKGVIRYKNVRGPKLESALKALIDEVKVADAKINPPKSKATAANGEPSPAKSERIHVATPH